MIFFKCLLHSWDIDFLDNEFTVVNSFLLRLGNFVLFTSDFPGFGESYWYLYWCSSTGILSLVALNIFNLPWFFRGLIMFRYVFIWVSPILSLFSFFKLCACSVAQSCLTHYDPMDCNPPGSSVHGIFQAKILEWVAISFPKVSSWSRDHTQVSCIVKWILYHWATWEAQSLVLCILLNLGNFQHLEPHCSSLPS